MNMKQQSGGKFKAVVLLQTDLAVKNVRFLVETYMATPVSNVRF